MTVTAPQSLTPEEIDALEPVYIGPTWKKNEDGSWALPKRTLGWQILGWCAEYLNNFNGTPRLSLSREQARLILWWYAVDDTGQFIYKNGVIQRLKGWGKDPLLAVITLVEFAGPSRVKWIDEDAGIFEQDELGNPIGVSHPNAWVQIAAVNQTQTRNTMRIMPSIMSKKFIDTYGVKPGAELTRGLNGQIHLEAVTSSPRALEGGRTTFTLLNETQHWIRGNKGHDMYDTVFANLQKTGSRFIAITNAYLPGEDSVAERVREAWQRTNDGRSVDVGMMYDSIEAHPRTPLTPEALRIVLPKIRGDSVWLKIEPIITGVLNTTISASRSRRMWLNQVVAEEDALYGPDQWSAIEDPEELLDIGDDIVLGFDGSKSDDATALVAIRIRDRCAFVLCLEEKPIGPAGDNWEVNRARVNSAVHEAFQNFNVKGFYADVAYWESYIDQWAETYRSELSVKASGTHAIAWDMRSSLQLVTRSHERLMQAVFDVDIKTNGDPDLRRHALNARRNTNKHGISFAKESRESPRKVDLYAALMLAFECLHDLRTKANVKPQRTGQGWFM